MKVPQSDHEWQELFRKTLPDAPVPPAVSRYTRARLRQQLQAVRVRSVDRQLDAIGWSESPAWLRSLAVAVGRIGQSPSRAWLSVVMIIVVAIAALFMGVPTQTVQAASVRLNGGSAFITRARTGVTSKLQGNQVSFLEPGDELSTQAGTATITCFNGQVTRVMPGTRVKLISLSQQGNAKRVQFAVWQGRLQVQLDTSGSPGDRFEVVSPSSTASVRSNQAAITVDVRSDQETRYQADAGTASVTMGSQTVNVQAGQEVLASTGNTLTVADHAGVAQNPPTSVPALSTGPTPTESPAHTVPAAGSTVTPAPPLPTPSPIIPPMETLAPTATQTPVELIIPILTNTVIPPTETPTHTLIPPTYTPTPTSTATPHPTDTPMPLPTNTPLPTQTNTPVPVPTNTTLPTPTVTPSPVPSDTPVPTPTNTPTPTLTMTPTVVPSPTPTIEPTTTVIPTAEVTSTSTPGPQSTALATATPTAPQSGGPTAMPMPDQTPLSTVTNTPTPPLPSPEVTVATQATPTIDPK